jgi:uncharacterized protein
MSLSPVELLILQPTPFCNLNCSYCYLPDRVDRRVMKVDTVHVTLEKLHREELLSPNLSVVWHAGEPMVVTRQVYARYFTAIQEAVGPFCEVRHHIQTNATLIDDAWCDFFLENKIAVGISVDGPESVHDRCRRSRAGRGSFCKTLQGIMKMRENRVSFHTISVVTSASLEHPKEIYAFLASLEPEYIAFNVEEQEGLNLQTSLQEKAEGVETFFRTIYELAKAKGFNPPIREFESACQAIQGGRGSEQNFQIWPYRIFAVAVDGGFTTFSPELLGMDCSAYGSLSLGNILTDSPRAIADSGKLAFLLREIHAGVKRCKETCEYFEVCGGGAPSNKLFEKGTFDVAATSFCESSVKVPLRIVLEDLESALEGTGAECTHFMSEIESANANTGYAGSRRQMESSWLPAG